MKFNWNKTLNNNNKTPVSIFKPNIGTSTMSFGKSNPINNCLENKIYTLHNIIIVIYHNSRNYIDYPLINKAL